MKAAIYSPFLDTFGGGEKYMMTIAEILASDYLVDILLDTNLQRIDNLKGTLSTRFNLDLVKVNFIPAPFGRGSNFLQRLLFLKKYDLLFYLTDGSIFYPTSKKNILHIQSPIVGQPAKSIVGMAKLKGWNYIIYNSEFTKANSQKNWPLNSKIIYPPVDILDIKSLRKKKYILSVGRFFGYLKDKKHKLLISIFKKIHKDPQFSKWSLHLVGSASDGDQVYLEELKRTAKNMNVKFYPNLGYDELVRLYGESSIYWHAAGFGEKDPTKMEHFGISTVEAMSAGCVPVVIEKGGLKEIVENNRNGFLWDSLDELEQKTLFLIKNRELMENLSKNAIKKATEFSKKKFEDNIKDLLKQI